MSRSRKGRRHPLEIDPTEYQKIRKLGQGSYGRVNLVEHQDSHRQFAMKLMALEDVEPNDVQYLRREIEIMTQLKNDAVLSLIGFSFPKGSKGDAVILTKYMQNGSVERMTRKESGGSAPADWDLTRKFIVLIGCASGMRYLHAKDIIHRDLKPGNVLLDENYNPYIADFGFSKFAGTSRKSAAMSMVGGTMLYMAPELYASGRYGLKVDVYAFAMMMYEILTALEPFKSVPAANMIPLKVINGKRPVIPESVPPAFRDLIQDCWENNPDDRPTFDDIVRRFLSDDFYMPNIMDMAVVRAYQERVVINGYILSRMEYLETENAQLGMRVGKLEKMVKRLASRNQELLERLDVTVKAEMETETEEDIISVRVGEKKGVIAEIVGRSKSVFDRRVTISSSSCDIYELIDPDSQGTYMTGDDDRKNYLHFQFNKEIEIDGLKLVSGDSCFLKHWRFVKGDDTVYESSGREELNRKRGEVGVRFNAIKGKEFMIEQTGPNWEGGKGFAVSNIAFIRQNVNIFLEMLEKSDDDPHRAAVVITAKMYDPSELYRLRGSKILRTLAQPAPSWVQIEFVDAVFCVIGIRLKAVDSGRQRWNLRATNDVTKPLAKWTLIELETKENPGESGPRVMICEKSKPFNYYRIVLKDGDPLQLKHFDMFGDYNAKYKS